MSTRAPRRSTRSQSRETTGLFSDEDAASVTTSRKSNGTSGNRKSTISNRKVKKPDVIMEDEQNLSDTPLSVRVKQEMEEIETEDVEAEKQLRLFKPTISSLPNTTKANKVRQKLSHMISRLGRLVPYLPPLLILASYTLAALLLSPSEPFSRKVYVDENALQPGSANVEWGWSQVELADHAADRVAQVADSSSGVAAFLARELRSFGLTAHNQSYTFTVPSKDGSEDVTGMNTYARFPAARGDGREAFVLAASWKSGWDGANDPDSRSSSDKRFDLEGAMTPYQRMKSKRSNLRGIASTLILARHLSGYSHWSKDLIFVFSDGELEGMQAWTSAYFGREQSNMKADKLQCGSSAIWNAIALDYPSDSFSHIVLKHEGLQGQLPNMDVINTFTRVAQRTDGIPVSLSASSEHDEGWSEEPLGAIGIFLEKHLWKESDGSKRYLSGLLNVIKQISFLSAGEPSGIHGLFHRYHVDAITVFMHPAPGPYGFHHLGRAVESMTRSMSNLLERLHHSQFFYLLTSPYRFIEVAKYLPVVVLLSAALSITGISLWMDEGNRSHLRKAALVDLVRMAIEDEESEDGFGVVSSVPVVGGGAASVEDLPLQSPTSAQLLSSLTTLLVDRSLRRGDLLGTSKLRSSAALMQVLGRPTASAIGVVLSCHVIGTYAYYIISRAPVDCAMDGLEQCKPLRLVTAATILSTLLLVWRVCKANTRLLARRLSPSQTLLPQAALPFLASFQSFRIKAIARSVHTFALLEAGMLLLAISLVNFSLALVLGIVLCIPMCASTLPPSTTTAEESAHSLFSHHLELERSLSPVSNDTDHVEAITPSLPKTLGLSLRRRFSHLTRSFAFLLLTPSSLVYLAKAASLVSCSTFPDKCPASTYIDWIFDHGLLQHHLIGTLTIPAITFIYLPLVLLESVANILAALG